MPKTNRDDFTPAIKLNLAKRVAFICSNPSCHKLTIGPLGQEKTSSIGVASHICAAAPGGPRFDRRMSEEERKSIENGIWLCQSCSRMIDVDYENYPAELLKSWKKETENTILYNYNERINFNRNDKLIYAFDILKNWKNWAEIADEQVEGYYYKENPSYRIIIEDCSDNHNPEFYSYLQTNESTYFSRLKIYFNNTCLYSNQIVTLDTVLTILVPESGFVDYNDKTLKYKYLVKNSKEMILFDFLYNFGEDKPSFEQQHAMRMFDMILTIFDNEEDAEYYNEKLRENIAEIDLLRYADGYNYAGNNENEIYINRLEIGLGKYIKTKYESDKNI